VAPRSRSVSGREIVSVTAGEGRPWASQQAARNCLRMFRFQAASLVPGPPFHGDMTACLAHPVGRTGPVMSLQGGERPVRVGQHVDAALRADQDGDIGRIGRWGSSFRRFQDRFGVIEKCSHTELIGTERVGFRENLANRDVGLAWDRYESRGELGGSLPVGQHRPGTASRRQRRPDRGGSRHRVRQKVPARRPRKP